MRPSPASVSPDAVRQRAIISRMAFPRLAPFGVAARPPRPFGRPSPPGGCVPPPAAAAAASLLALLCLDFLDMRILLRADPCAPAACRRPGYSAGQQRPTP